MKLIGNSLLTAFVTMLVFFACTEREKIIEASLKSIPDTTVRNSNYKGNRAPLVASPYIKLPVGAVQPEGWLLEMMNRQRDGLTGNLGRISAWLQKEDNAWLNPKGEGKWGWEEVPYWLKGYSSMAYILANDSMQQETRTWIQGVLNSQRSDGNFGPTFLDKENREDFWPKMIMLYCLQTYYEHTGEKQVLDFMGKFFQYQLAYDSGKFLRGHYWQGVRTGDNLHSVIWLYNQTGDTTLLQLMARIHRNSNSWSNRNVAAKQGNHVPVDNQPWPEWYNQLTDWHNVNVAQGFREPATWYQVSHRTADLQASYEVFSIVRDHFGQVPGGMFGGDEVSRPGFSDPRQGIETCGIVEQMNSDEHMLRITGDLFWADHTEEVAFNQYPAAVMPDFKSLRYLTSPNMVLNDDQNHAPGIFNNGPYLMMNPFSSRCCQHNHTQGWPYFTENLWLATPDDGIAAVLYAPSHVRFKSGQQEVTIREETRYPFESNIRLTIETDEEVTFPLYVRIPGWAMAAKVRVNGKPVGVQPMPGSLVKLSAEWNDGDVVDLEFPMEPRVKTWAQNNHSVSIEYGPLTFALKIGEAYRKKESDKTAQYDAKWQPGADTKSWPSYEIHPTTPWNYGLAADLTQPYESFQVKQKPWPADNFPFTTESVPLEIRTIGKTIPEWTLDQYGLCAPLQPSPVNSNQPTDSITLIPMGAARLRISAFPSVGGANVWTPSKP